MGDLFLVALGAASDLTEFVVHPSSKWTCYNLEKWEDQTSRKKQSSFIPRHTLAPTMSQALLKSIETQEVSSLERPSHATV